MGYDKEYYEETGNKIWRNDKGQRHRLDGPAVEDADGYKSWRIHDKYLTEEEFNNHPLVIQHQLLKELDNGV